MRRYPALYHRRSFGLTDEATMCEIDGVWCPARPIGSPSFWRRLKLAWGVFTARYDALKWDGDQ